MNWVHPTALLLAAWITAFAESWFDGFRGRVGAQPDLMPALVVYAALSTGLTTTTAVAMVGGLGVDSLSSGPFGLGMLPLVGLGVVLHRRRDLLLRDSTLAQVILGGAATAAVVVASAALLLIVSPVLYTPDRITPFWPERRFGESVSPEFGLGFLWQLLVVTAVGAAATPMLFRLFDWVESTFNYRPVSEPTYRADREIKRGRY